MAAEQESKFEKERLKEAEESKVGFQDADEDESPVLVPDGGWGWMVCLASFTVNFIIDGTMFSFGILLLELLDDLQETKAITSWVGSTQLGMSMMMGPLVSVLLKRFSVRQVTIAGTLLSAVGFIVSVFAPNVYVLILMYGIVGGTGFSMIYMPAIIVVGLYFNKKRAIATGIATSGSGLGTFAYAYLCNQLLRIFTWRQTILILTAILLNCLACGLVFRPLIRRRRQRKPNAQIRGNSQSASTCCRENGKEPECCASSFASMLCDEFEEGRRIKKREGKKKMDRVGSMGEDGAGCGGEDGGGFDGAKGDGNCQRVLPKPTVTAGESVMNGCELVVSDVVMRDVNTVNTCEQAPISVAGTDEQIDSSGDKQIPNFVGTVEETAKSFQRLNQAGSHTRGMVDTQNSGSDGTASMLVQSLTLQQPGQLVSSHNRQHQHVHCKNHYKHDNDDGANLVHHYHHHHHHLRRGSSDEVQARSALSPSRLAHGSFFHSVDNFCTHLKAAQSPNIKEQKKQLVYFSERELSPDSGVRAVTRQHHKVEIERGYINERLLCPIVQKDTFYGGSISHLLEFQQHEGSKTPFLAQGMQRVSDKSAEGGGAGDIVEGAGGRLLVSACMKGCVHSVCDTQLFGNKAFLLLLITFVMWTVQSVALTYLPNLAVSKGIARDQAAYLIAIVGITNIVGRILAGLFTDLVRIRSIWLYILALFLAAAMIYGMPWCPSFAMLASASVLFGLCMAVAVSMRTIVLAEQLGIHVLTQSFGVVALFQGIAFTVNPPLAGKLFDETGTYSWPFSVAATMYLVSALACLCVGLWCKPHQEPASEVRILSVEEIVVDSEVKAAGE